jgi:hypothetical protein
MGVKRNRFIAVPGDLWVVRGFMPPLPSRYWADNRAPPSACKLGLGQAFSNAAIAGFGGGVLVMLLLIGGWQLFHPAARVFTPPDIDNAVKYTPSHTDPPPADTTIAAAMVGPSVVRVEAGSWPEHAARKPRRKRPWPRR